MKPQNSEITITVRVPIGADASAFTSAIQKVVEHETKSFAEAVKTQGEAFLCLENDAVLENWIRHTYQWDYPNGLPYTRARNYTNIEWQQELSEFPLRRDGRRPVLMRAACDRLRVIWDSAGWRGRVIERYLRIARYSNNNPKAVSEYLWMLNGRLFNAKPGWRSFLTNGKGSRSAPRSSDGLSLCGYGERLLFSNGTPKRVYL